MTISIENIDNVRSRIEVAAHYLTKTLANHLCEEKCQKFHDALIWLMHQKYCHHWFPENPRRGQGYRCIELRQTGPVDRLIQQAAFQIDLKYSDLMIPPNVTVWIDPDEVAYRYGDHGSVSAFDFHSFDICTSK